MKKGFFLSALSGVLMALPWLGCGSVWLLAGMTPMLELSRRTDSARKMFGWVCLWTAVWYACAIWWVWYAAPAGPIAATIAAVMYTGTAFMIFHAVSKRAPRALAYTVLVCGWITAEYLYNIWQLSFPWMNLGNGFARQPWMVQWYEFTGAYGGTLWALLCNIVLYECIPRRRFAAPAAAVLLPVLLSLIMYLGFRVPERTAQVSIVQPDIDPWEEKFEISQSRQTGNMLCLASQAPHDVQFILMPETALDEDIDEQHINASPSVGRLRHLLKESFPQATLITGATTLRWYDGPHTPTARRHRHSGQWYDVYNTAIGIDTSQVTTLHHKNKLVIGAEMMPSWRWLNSLEKYIIDLGGTTGQLGTDSFRRTFRSADSTVAAAMICYESIYGAYVSEFVQRGAQLLCVITNDGWWGDTPGYRQHFSYSRLRAVESRRSIARCANTGISGFIDPRGKVVSSLGWDRRGLLSGRVPLNDKITFYTRHGDYICSLSAYLLALSLLYFAAYRIRLRNHLTK